MTLEELLLHHKTKRAVAAAYGVTPQAITHWTRQGFIPFYSQIKIEYISKGMFKADEYDKHSKRFCTKNFPKSNN